MPFREVAADSLGVRVFMMSFLSGEQFGRAKCFHSKPSLCGAHSRSAAMLDLHQAWVPATLLQ